MIKVNLLHPPGRGVKTKVVVQPAQTIAGGCAVILAAAAVVIGWRYGSLSNDSARLDREIAEAQQETTRLRSVVVQVQQVEQRRTQLQDRVALIEQLRRDQTGPVHMLDQISRALPHVLWLTELKHTHAADEVVIHGRSTELTGLSDFVVNLEASGYFKRPVEIVSSMTDISSSPGVLIKFEIRAVFQPVARPSDQAMVAEAPGPVVHRQTSSS